MSAPRKYNVYRSNLAETKIGSYPDHDDAKEAAQQYADEHAEKVYIMWNADNGGTVSQPIESNATADELETWAMNHASTYEEYFLPLARTTERRYRKDRDKAHEHARRMAINMAEVAAHRFDRERASYGGHRYLFTADVQRQAADQIAAYIISELDAGNSWL